MHKFVKITLLKKLLFFLVILTFFAGCKPTSMIITSKSEAKKKGIYQTPEGTIIIKTEKQKKAVASIKAPKKEPKKEIKSRLSTDEKSDDFDITNSDTTYLVQQLINSASENLGANYKSGGTTPEGYDCSGLMFATFSKFDIILPRSSNEMSRLGTVLNADEIKKGDLIFFKTNGRKIINHVGMVTEILPNEIKFIHSATSKGVIISSTKEPYYSRTFAQANRIYSTL
ncbi:MAG: NlpC/P60 family protein [Flavobacteriaceae bacterium]|nr:NlpC/P60 family protein [Flavobacteriaceae bacterium]